MEIPRGIRFHRYNYAYPGEQPEGIRSRIRQGVGGPEELEVGADVHGHLHLPSGQRILPGEEVTMGFKGQEWKVVLDHHHMPCSCVEGMIRQDDPETTGHEVQGTCTEMVK